MEKISSFTTATFQIGEGDYIAGIHDFGEGGYKNYKFPASSLPANNLTARTLTSANNGQTLNTTDYILWCLGDESNPSVTMPDPSTMTNQQVIFVNIQDSGENYFTINGIFLNADYYALSGLGYTITFISNGTTWYILNEYIPS